MFSLGLLVNRDNECKIVEGPIQSMWLIGKRLSRYFNAIIVRMKYKKQNILNFNDCCSLSNGWMICLWTIKAYGSIMACVLFVSFISQIKIFLFRGNSLEFIWNVCRLIQPSIWTKHHWNGNWNNVPCLFLHLSRKRSKNLHAFQINNKFTSLILFVVIFQESNLTQNSCTC